MTLEVQVFYPIEGIRELPGGEVFSLFICYEPQCPQNSFWNQSIPGMPYDPAFTIYNTSYVGNNQFNHEIVIPDFNGTVYLVLSAVFYPAGYPLGLCSIINYCNWTAGDPGGNYCVNVGMPYYSQEISPGQGKIVAYPYFGMNSGFVYTIFPNFFSPQLGNFRDINVYVPSSYYQNTVQRNFSILVVNDGSLYSLQQLTGVGGFDRAVVTGAVPETIMIGIPQNVTGCERTYELTYSLTDQLHTSCRTGGNHVYFNFVLDTVIPAVVANLSIGVAEIGMTGVSYGGLTACYAASALPAIFRRVYCQSPSTWWNYGQLPSVILGNATNGPPLSVAIYIGTNEMADPEAISANSSATTEWFTFVNETAFAFLAIGVPKKNVYFFTVNGGNHDLTAWATSFQTGVVQMYSPNFTSPYQRQYAPGANINVIVPQESSEVIVITDDDDDGGCSSGPRDREIAFIAIFVVETVLLLALGGYFLSSWCQQKNGGLAAQENSHKNSEVEFSA